MAEKVTIGSCELEINMLLQTIETLTAERDAEFEYRKKVERERLHHSSEREALARQLAAMTEERDELSRLHKSAVLECQRSFVREEICAKEMARRDARTNKPRTSPQAGWDELRRQLAAMQTVTRSSDG